jgi:signal transduction histidine kinase
MKLTKKLEAEILKTYNAYWDNYLKGDVEAMHPLLADEYTQVGSAEAEVFSNKKDAVQFLYDTIDQVAKKLEMRHRKTTIEKQDNSILVHEFCDLYALANNKWVFYSKFRASSLMLQKKDGWKFIHQHSSFPDTKTEEGQNIAIDKIAEENLQLREAVKRRTIELENKNRELEIETALEKVRTVAMAMKKADDMLSVCKTISQQLGQLGVKEIRNVQTAIFYEGRGTYMNYEYYTKHDKTFITDVDYKNHKIQLNFAKKMMKGKNEEVLEHLKGKKMQDWYTYQKSTNQFADNYLLKAQSLNYYWYSLGPVALGISTYYPLTKDETVLFKRFLKVFELAYRRYLDIEKATAQAREAQIEVALERIRAASLAMMDSSALSGIIYKLYGELTKLDAKLDRCFIMIVNPENKGITWWMAGQEGLLAENGFFVQMNEHPSHLMYLNYCKQRKKKWTYLFQGKEKKDWDRFGFSKTELARLPEPVKTFMAAAKAVHLSGSSDQFGSLVTGSFEPLPEEQQDIISRFAIAFNQAYIRFLDLQKAEAQTREAQIEAALEKVRSRSMAMHTSQELKEVALELRKQMGLLGQKDLEVCAIHLYDDEHSFESWSAMKVPDSANEILQTQARFPIRGFRIVDELMKKYEDEEKDYIIVNEGVKSVEWFGVLKEYAPELHASILRAVGDMPLKKLKSNWSVADFSGGALVMVTYGEPDPASRNLLRRSANVFEQAYIRFLDLKKAEAQAREAQIEVALERVRSRSMAMHKSEELADLSLELVKQVQALGVATWFCAFNIYDDEVQGSLEWGSNGQGTFPKYRTPREGVFLRYFEAGQKGESLLINEIGKEECPAHYEYLCTLPGVGDQLLSMKRAGIPFPDAQIDHVAFFRYGYIIYITYAPAPESHEIFIRFAKVFEQTYTRFLDLQKSEAQAREAKIEAALERVRSRSLAMHHSSELSAVVDTLLREFTNLEFTLTFCIINLINEQDRSNTVWAANPEAGKEPESYYMKFEDYPFHHAMWKAWKAQDKRFVYTIEGEEKRIYDQYLYTDTEFSRFPENVKQANRALERYVAGFTFFRYSGLQTVSVNTITEAELEILERFGRVFEQSYTRFLDLQKAEAQTKEAQIEAALEKVRSRSLAMQKPNELTEVAELLRKEMGQLGVEELETSSIYIVDEENKQVECWYAIKDVREENKQLVSDEMTITFAETWVGSEMRKFYQSKKQQASIIMKGDNRKEWINYCAEKSNVLKGYYGDEIPERTYHLVKFNGGYMGAASPGDISAESWDLLRRAASVFSLAYTRFNDLQIAEAHALQAELDLIAIKDAKQKAEEALTELQATQKQLIQSEKMASLGELTAGIAHEIQNPLNFVNNFSEVSKELLDEMREAIEKGDTDDAKDIMNDVIQNLEKINHHGKRADGIVKGMLQHSSSGSGKKEPTNINALADEYLRLSYHGLRAKDKSFNATMKTDFDESIGNINIIPQDIGRVILNLITNAFYVVNEKSKQGIVGYEPTVSITTSSIQPPSGGRSVQIKVSDNGGGIPQKILDKIFQPFFTTKPTGQGTGLGLSLSYDIVKAHGGELKVETNEGKGSEFIIQLPVV